MKEKALICGYYPPEEPIGTRYYANKIALQELFEVADHSTTKMCSFKAKLEYISFIIRTIKKGGYSVVFIYPYNYLLPSVLGLTKPYHKARVVFDLFQSAVLATWSHTHNITRIIKVWLMSLLATHLSDVLLCLSKEYRDYYHGTLLIRRSKLPIVMDGIGIDWIDRPCKDTEPDGITRVIYWGNFLLAHDLPLVISVAKELESRKDIKFIVCGGGVRTEKIKLLAWGLSNVEFKGRLPIGELIDEVDRADMVLGSLLNISDSYLSAANKQIEGMVREKPVVTISSQQKKDLYKAEGMPFPPLILLRNPALSLKTQIEYLADNPEFAAQVGVWGQAVATGIHNQDRVNSAMKEALK